MAPNNSLSETKHFMESTDSPSKVSGQNSSINTG
jgi:hypothetical protein